MADKYNRTMVESVCSDCGETRMVRLSAITLAKKQGCYTGRCPKCNCKSRKGEGHPLWNGGRYVTSSGYVKTVAPDGHPYANTGNYISEHRLVMEQHLGRYLDPKETVHHKDGNRQNNELANLELWTGNHNRGVRVSDLEGGMFKYMYYTGLLYVTR